MKPFESEKHIFVSAMDSNRPFSAEAEAPLFSSGINTQQHAACAANHDYHLSAPTINAYCIMRTPKQK